MSMFTRINALALGLGLSGAGCAKLMKMEPEVRSIQALHLPDWTIRNIGTWQVATGSMLLAGGIYPSLTLFRVLGVYGSYASVGGQFAGLFSRSGDSGMSYADWQIQDGRVQDRSQFASLSKLPVIYGINACQLFLTYTLSRFGCGSLTGLSHDFLLNFTVLSCGYYGISTAVDEMESCPDFMTWITLKQKQFETSKV